MLRHRHADRDLSDDALLFIADDRRLALPAGRWGCAIEFNEIDRRLRLHAMRHAIAHSGADEREMRVSIARFDNFLCVRKLGAEIHLIVAVFATLREQRTKRME